MLEIFIETFLHSMGTQCHGMKFIPANMWMPMNDLLA